MDIKLMTVGLLFALILNIIFLLIYDDIHMTDKLYTEEKEDIVMVVGIISIILLYIDSLYLSSIFSSGYGNKIFAIIIQIVFFLCWVLSFIEILAAFIEDFANSTVSYFIIDVVFILIFLLGSIYTIGCLYLRLRLENMLKIGWIDKIIEKYKNIHITSNISKWLENEWVKGIAIATISGIISSIIAALILDKLNKNKNSNDKNANGENINNNKKP